MTNNNNLTGLLALMGKRVIYAGQRMAAVGTVRNVRQAYGRTDVQLEDCNGALHWVDAAQCKVTDDGK